MFPEQRDMGASAKGEGKWDSGDSIKPYTETLPYQDLVQERLWWAWKHLITLTERLRVYIEDNFIFNKNIVGEKGSVSLII